MSDINITIPGGTSKRLLTKGKRCEADIVVTAEGGGSAVPVPEDLTAELTEQEELLAELRTTLEGKAGGEGTAEPVLQEKSVTNKERLQANNADLQEMIGIAEALPDAGSGGDAVDVIAGISNKTITEAVSDKLITLVAMFTDNKVLKTAKFPNCVTASGRVFQGCTSLETIEMPNLEEITGSDFASECTSLISISLPKLKKAGLSYQGYAFYNCRSLRIAELPVLEIVEASTFHRCQELERLDFHCINTISSTSFNKCAKLQTFIIRSENVCTLSNANAFSGTPIESGTGYIYVPKALLSDDDSTKDYRRATNWSTYAAQFRAIEDYPDITGG